MSKPADYIVPEALLLNTPEGIAKAIREVIVPAINALSGAIPESVGEATDLGVQGSPVDEEALPETFPYRDELAVSGITTYGDVKDALSPEPTGTGALEALPGIGKAKAKKIAAAAGIRV